MHAMISRFFRPIIEGFRGVIRHGSMALSSSLAVTITLFIISLFLVLTFNFRRFTQGLEQSVQISVLVDYGSESAEEEGRISTAIQNIEGVSSVNYSSKADEFEYYINSFNDEKTKEAFEPFRDDNPMHDAYYVEVSDGSLLESIAEEIQTIPGVYRVNFGGSSAVKLITALRTVRLFGGGLALVLSLLAISLIQNTIKLTIQARADEIAIMRNVGAKNGFIRAPFLVEGILIGFLGSILPAAAVYFGYQYLYKFTGGAVISNMFTLIEPFPFIWYVIGAVCVIGILVGFIGSYFSVTRYLRWRR